MKKKIKVKVKANSKRNAIIDNVVYVKEVAKNGKANVAVVKLFKKKFGLDVEIVRGLRSKEKVLKIIS